VITSLSIEKYLGTVIVDIAEAIERARDIFSLFASWIYISTALLVRGTLELPLVSRQASTQHAVFFQRKKMFFSLIMR
jgi:hypothetical protein